MADVLEFTTAPKGEDTADDAVVIPPLAVTLDGFPLVINRPKDALLAEIGAINSRRTNVLEKIRLSLNFLDDCLEEPGRAHVRSRLTDEHDDLDAEDLLPILEAVGEHWKAHAPKRARRDRRR